MKQDLENNKKNRLINFFTDRIFIYALFAAVIVTYFYIDYKRYTFFGPILNEFVELVIIPIIWVIYKLKTKKTFLYNSKEILKFSIIYSLLIIFSSLFIQIMHNMPQHFGYYFSWFIGRIIIIYIWIAFINVICRMITNSIKFIFKK